MPVKYNFSFPRACVFDCLSIVVNSSQRKFIPNIFWGGFVFIFSPVFPKDSSFLFFFLQTACIGTAHCRWSETISPLKKNSWWNYIKKKNLQKSSRRLCPIMDCSTGERILIYIFKKIEIWKKKPRWFNWYSMKKATFPEKCWSILLSRTQTSNFLLFRDDKIIDLITTARLYYKG